MGKLLHILSILALLVHLTVCCCSCHALDCNRSAHFPTVRGTAVSVEQGSQVCCEHSPSGPRDCRGARCSLVAPRRTLNGPLIPSVQLPCAVLCSGEPACVGIMSQRVNRTSVHYLPPVRLHLANQVLMI